MDTRWQAPTQNSVADVKVILHPTAEIRDVKNGTAADGVDISAYVSQGRQSCFDCSLTLNWNYELYGANQPRPNQVLEVQLLQDGVYQTVWIGIIEQISGYTATRGQRSMEVTARSRNNLNMWKETQRVTQLYPQMTDFSVILNDIAKICLNLYEEEVVIPNSSYTTAHSNTQLAGLSAWDMITQLALPLGWSPFVDGLGRLRMADKNLMNRTADIVLTDEQNAKATASRTRPPTTRVRIKWLNPLLTKQVQVARKLGDAVITFGWFLPYMQKTVWFSEDHTQRAENCRLKVKQSANGIFGNLWGGGAGWVLEEWDQTEPNGGVIRLTNLLWAPAIVSMIYAWHAAHSMQDQAAPGVWAAGGLTPNPCAGPVTPTGRQAEAWAQLAVMLVMMLIGTGVYEVWGNPYDWVHARNVTEAFDQNSPGWVDNPSDIECDFIVSEAHAQVVAVRELIWQAKSANKWSATMLNDPRVEYGDIVEFADGSKMLVEDYSRNLTRGGENTMEIRGFLI